MRTILLISPHYPPSNLAAVHRSRLFAQHLHSFGWKSIILAVHEKYYEEKLDWELLELLPTEQRIEKVKAFQITAPRIIGDIGLRAYLQLRKRALKLIKSEKVDIIYFLVPSFYTSLLGPYLFKKTGVPYGIDYIDPWVHRFPGSDRIFSRHWFSTQLAKILEPIAVKNVSLITGVSEGYFIPVLDRNPHLKGRVVTAAMPYGGEVRDYDYVRNHSLGYEATRTIMPESKKNVFRFVYAGALLPKAYKPLEEILKALSIYTSSNKSEIPEPELHFIGTSGVVKPIAEKYGVWNSKVFEYPDRISYLDVLRNLDAADGILILGSTEPHYTPSKVYQGVLSRKPILAVLHKKSTAVNVLIESQAGKCVLMNGENDIHTLGDRFNKSLTDYLAWALSFDPQSVNMEEFKKYSAFEATRTLVTAIEKSLNRRKF